MSVVKIVERSVKALRGLLMAVLLMAVLIPVVVYVVLSSDWASDRIRQIGQNELSTLLGTKVDIGRVEYSPFNIIEIDDVAVADDNDSTALRVRSIEARFEMWELLLRQKFIIDYATVTGLDLKLYADSAGAPLNIARIIERLKSDNPEREPARFELRLNDVRLDDCSLSYNVLQADSTPGRFNPRHIAIKDLHLAAFAPVVSNDDYRVRLRSLGFMEQSGFVLTDLSVAAELSQRALTLNNLHIELPASSLDFADIDIPVDSLKHIDRIATGQPVTIAIEEGSHISLPALRAFVPALATVDYDIAVTAEVSGTRDSVDIRQLRLADRAGILQAQIAGSISGLGRPQEMSIRGMTFDVAIDTVAVAKVLRGTGANLSPTAARILAAMGNVTVNGSIDGTPQDIQLDATSHSRLGKARLEGRIQHLDRLQRTQLTGHVQADSLLIGHLLDNRDLNSISAHADIDGWIERRRPAGHVTAIIDHLDYKGYRYHDIDIDAEARDDDINATLRVDDPNAAVIFTASMGRDEGLHTLHADLDLASLRLDTLHLGKAWPGYALSGRVRVDGRGESIDRFAGQLTADDVALLDASGQGIRLNSLYVDADNITSKGRIVVASDYLNGTVDGDYRLSTLVRDIRDTYQALLPALEPAGHKGGRADTAGGNDFTLDFTVSRCDSVCEFFHLPLIPVGDIDIDGHFDASARKAYLMVDMPWLEMGNSIVQHTTLVADINAGQQAADAFVTSYIPTKKGNMDVRAYATVHDGDIDTNILWSLEPEKPISGNIDFTTRFSRDAADRLVTQVRFNPGTINFGDEIWDIRKSLITYSGGKAMIDNFALNTATQALWVNGMLGPDESDRLSVDLKNIQLINIFETLEINNVLLSGSATGTVQASALLGKQPVIECDALHVRQIGYNYCTLGDALVHLSFDDGGSVFRFHGDITGDDGRLSTLDGYIIPATEQLDLNINADHVKVGFMKPFMEAFTSDVSGYASGRAHLFGTFKDLDMDGAVYAQDLRIKIDFTNTYYYATDSIIIRPGIIELNNVVLQDEYKNTAMLNGWVRHRYFHDASFDFNIDRADDFLCYDVGEKISPIWYGRIFGDGSAHIKGQPGLVDISINMSTSPRSTFTFVLSDQLEADEYSFITFRDVTPVETTDTILQRSTVPERVVLKRQHAQGEAESPTVYRMDIVMNVEPDAAVNLVMDPVGGDCIRSNGRGLLRVTYDSTDNDFRLYGKYTLTQGKYNFTLQDIIIKDFTIVEGSSIQFDGDPYAAKLDIKAYLQVNANLSDLDESFLQDKELNRTNVPVRAMLNVTGDLRQFALAFGLEFPTLSEDISRKVHSIISTDDMMSKQIIYLLALNRFYTPEYMASTTKGNELFSVASSTISSQLSSMLGKLSDNWSIAPNLRSDRGDFSDLEVDVALSSSLLNNRLLFNGNFGYRDKSLNTNQFVGDFDLEYLLTRSGEWRLKAYNRYNDQNYYLRSALTTQGVGVVYRRDFDKTLRFLGRLGRKTAESPDTLTTPPDTISYPVDTIPAGTRLIEIDMPGDTIVITK